MRPFFLFFSLSSLMTPTIVPVVSGLPPCRTEKLPKKLSHDKTIIKRRKKNKIARQSKKKNRKKK